MIENISRTNEVSCEMNMWLVHKLGWASHGGDMSSACDVSAQLVMRWSREDKLSV